MYLISSLLPPGTPRCQSNRSITLNKKTFHPVIVTSQSLPSLLLAAGHELPLHVRLGESLFEILRLEAWSRRHVVEPYASVPTPGGALLDRLGELAPPRRQSRDHLAGRSPYRLADLPLSLLRNVEEDC